MFNVQVEPDLDILFEKLTAHIDAWAGLGTQHYFGSISLKYSDEYRFSEAVPLAMAQSWSTAN